MDLDARIVQHIELNPSRPGLVNARLREYGVAVWALIGYLRAADGDTDRVAADYDVPRTAVEGAIVYNEHYPTIIDARLDATSAPSLHAV